MNIDQIFLMLLGCSAIWLVGRTEDWRKWGYLLGLLSQPFWFYTSYKANQWGIMLLSAWYTYSWFQGVYLHIIKPRRTHKGKIKMKINGKEVPGEGQFTYHE